MIQQYDIDQSESLREAQDRARRWAKALVTWQDALELCSHQLVAELRPTGAKLGDEIGKTPQARQVRERLAINVFARWERRKRKDVLHFAMVEAWQKVERDFDKAGIQHAGLHDISRQFSNHVIYDRGDGAAIIQFLTGETE